MNEYESYNEETYYLDLSKIEFFLNYKCEKLILFLRKNSLTIAKYSLYMPR